MEFVAQKPFNASLSVLGEITVIGMVIAASVWMGSRGCCASMFSVCLRLRGHAECTLDVAYVLLAAAQIHVCRVVVAFFGKVSVC